MTKTESTKRLEEENADERSRAERLVESCLRKAQGRGLVPSSRPDWTQFSKVLAATRSEMTVDESAITTPMARLFFAVASASEASNILVLGSFQGAALVWFAAARPTAECLGVDICPLATQRAQANIAAMGLSAKVRAMDGYALADEVGPQFDLVLVDVESPVDGRASKKICATMLRALRRRIAAGAVVLVHDACWAPFANDMALVRQELDAANGYPNTTSFAIDRYGVMLARRCNP